MLTISPLVLTWNWEAAPTERADVGFVVPIPTLPDESILALSNELVEKLTVSPPLDHIPLFRSLLKAKEGAETVPRP